MKELHIHSVIYATNLIWDFFRVREQVKSHNNNNNPL